MLKQLITVFFCSLLVVSCSYFEKDSKKEPIQEVDTIIDFNSVDAFPLFPNCKDIPSRKKQQICFQLEIAQHIYASLKQYQLNANEVINDTVLVKLKIDTFGITSLSGIQISPKTNELLPEFDSILKVSLQNLPKLQPAIKRAMPVTTEFTLPIVLKN
jgi:hypothetical protein